MKANTIGPCPKCMERRPFVELDQEIKRGIEYHLECRKCGAIVEIFIGPRAMTMREKDEEDDKQQKLFE